MSQFMEKADLVATKPGGLTTAECLAMGRPMLLFAPIPGQEEEEKRIGPKCGTEIPGAKENIWPARYSPMEPDSGTLDSSGTMHRSKKHPRLPLRIEER